MPPLKNMGITLYPLASNMTPLFLWTLLSIVKMPSNISWHCTTQWNQEGCWSSMIDGSQISLYPVCAKLLDSIRILFKFPNPCSIIFWHYSLHTLSIQPIKQMIREWDPQAGVTTKTRNVDSLWPFAKARIIFRWHLSDSTGKLALRERWLSILSFVLASIVNTSWSGVLLASIERLFAQLFAGCISAFHRLLINPFIGTSIWCNCSL